MSDAADAVWYVGKADGQREGPLQLSQLKQRIAAGQLTGETLVWKDGMPDWVPAQTVPELFKGRPAPSAAAPSASAPATPAAPSGQAPSGPAMPAAAPRGGGDFMGSLDRMFSSPKFFRMVGRACVVVSVLLLLFSSVLYFAVEWSWFNGAVMLLLFFFIGEAAGAILDRGDGTKS